LSDKVDDDVPNRLRAAGQQIPLGRSIERLRLIDDLTGYQPALAIVARPGPARSSDRHSARIG
jgi:hypothetical protein